MRVNMAPNPLLAVYVHDPACACIVDGMRQIAIQFIVEKFAHLG